MKTLEANVLSLSKFKWMNGGKILAEYREVEAYVLQIFVTLSSPLPFLRRQKAESCFLL